MVQPALQLTQEALSPAPPGQAALLRRLHSAIEPALPRLSMQQLAMALWAYATVGIAADWTDALLQQARCCCGCAGWHWSGIHLWQGMRTGCQACAAQPFV